EALLIDREKAEQRGIERERALSDEGRAEADRIEREWAAHEQADRDQRIAEFGEIAPGIYEDAGTGLRYEVRSSGTIMIEGANGEMAPYGSIASGRADANGVAFVSQLNKGE